jgi:hypothetical protein
MEVDMQTYQFNVIRNQAHELIRAYTSVNDKATIKSLQAVVEGNIREAFEGIEQPFFTQVFETINDVNNFREDQLNGLMNSIKDQVDVFPTPTKSNLTKLFKKVKKLKEPIWSVEDMRDYQYFSWNDTGNQKKFILALDQDGKHHGFVGNMSPTTTKGICTICKKTSQVGMFLSTTKRGGDGTYTKKGNYICYDAWQCNQQLMQLEGLEEFLATIKPDK